MHIIRAKDGPNTFSLSESVSYPSGKLNSDHFEMDALWILKCETLCFDFIVYYICKGYVENCGFVDIGKTVLSRLRLHHI